MKPKPFIILFILYLCTLPTWGVEISFSNFNYTIRDNLWQSFLNPPDSIRVGCYYYWVNEQVDPEGVKADLQWMKDNGITLAFLATDIRNRTTYDNPWKGQTFGKNKFQSRLWWKNLRTALKTAGELGIEMGIFNCPGWSQSGGPWVKPEEAMRNWTPQGIEVCKTKEGTDVMCSPCLKPIADRYFHAGINATILHVIISQPGDNRKPAVRPWFGTWFDRRSKNAKELKPLVTYLRRCNFMLQLGHPLNGAPDTRQLDDGTTIHFTTDSQFEIVFPDGKRELWNPETIQP